MNENALPASMRETEFEKMCDCGIGLASENKQKYM